MQHISWKIFSRGQGVFTKQFEGQAGTAVVIDWDRISVPDVEHRLSRMCAMVLEAHRRNTVYGLRLPGVEIEPEQGEAHRRICLETLALFGMA